MRGWWPGSWPRSPSASSCVSTSATCWRNTAWVSAKPQQTGEQNQHDVCAWTHGFAQTLVSLGLYLTALTLLLLGLEFSFPVVSFGIAVDMQDVCRTQSPLKKPVLLAAAAGWLTLVWAAHLLRGLTSVTCRCYAVLVLFQGTVWRFSQTCFGLWSGLQPGGFFFLGFWLYIHWLWQKQQQVLVINQPYAKGTLAPRIPLSALPGGLAGDSWVAVLALFGSTSELLFTVASSLTSSNTVIASSWRFAPVWVFELKRAKHGWKCGYRQGKRSLFNQEISMF